MLEYYFTFRSMTLAQQASFQLSREGIDAVFLRSPKTISTMGCGYAVRVDPIDARAAASALRAAGLRFEKAVQLDRTGMVREVYL